jgi:hypothetical protein
MIEVSVTADARIRQSGGIRETGPILRTRGRLNAPMDLGNVHAVMRARRRLRLGCWDRRQHDDEGGDGRRSA